MNMLDRALRQIAPGIALRRVEARRRLDVAMRYAATEGPFMRAVGRGTRGDADSAARQRDALTAISRDMIRNTPLATRAQQVIAANVVGDGIIPKVVTKDARTKEELLGLVESHFDTTSIDADGRQNLYGLQRLALNTVVESGEVLIRRRRRLPGDGLPLPFQIQILEPDYLDSMADQDAAPPTADRPGRNLIREGIEYDAIGRRVAYHLYDTHPGTAARWSGRWESRRVPASEILHIYRQDRPGQMRGVSWFAPVMMKLQDLADYEDAQLVRQQIASCFTAFRTTTDDPASVTEGEAAQYAGMEKLSPGRIQNLGPGEDIKFAEPPGVSGYDEFTRSVLRTVAAGLGITYEALSADLSNVNFSSGRMGRMEMDRNVSAWQWLMLIPQMMQPIGAWTLEAWGVTTTRRRPAKLDWVPPHRMLVDPAKEIGAMRDEVRAGFASRSGQVRRLGYDPERLDEEIAGDNARADERSFIFDTDPRRTSGAGLAQPDTEEVPDGPE